MHTIPGYTLAEELYESATSYVYRARRNSDDLPVILKMLKQEYPPPEELARFRREYEITRNLDIEGVIGVHDLQGHKNTLIMVVEDFGADSLANILKERPLALTEFLGLTIRITDILGRIHQQHIMHKDINPANIVWNPETDVVKIIDFGISTFLSREQPEIRSPEKLEGTLRYISPEQTGRMNRAMDYRTDFYSLGATFYHMLTGHPPFQADDALELVHCHLARMPVPPDELPGMSKLALTAESLISSELLASPIAKASFSTPQILSSIILKLMAKNAEDRYQSATGVKADVEFIQAYITNPGQLSNFLPGQHDFSDKLHIPQKIYGREQEITTLLAAFDRVNAQSSIDDTSPKSKIDEPASGRSLSLGRQNSQMLLVTGYSGIGKTALVHELYKPITAKRGYYA
jgi:serine/threonine protein kinase